MKLLQMMIFSLMLYGSFLSCAMHYPNSTVMVPSFSGNGLSQPPVTSSIFPTLSVPIGSAVKQPTKKAHATADIFPESLVRAAEKEIWERNLKAQKISDAINKNYLANDDEWLLKKKVLLAAGLHLSDLSASTQQIVTELNQLSNCGIPLDRQIINRATEINRRLDSLFRALVNKKIRNYSVLYFRDFHYDDRCLKPWEMDSFFNAQNPYSELNSHLQQYVQTGIENEYKKILFLPQNWSSIDVKKYALLKSSECGMHQIDGIQFLKDILRTRTLQSLPPKIKKEVKKEICNKLDILCASARITYKEGKFCDGDEFKQECK